MGVGYCLRSVLGSFEDSSNLRFVGRGRSGEEGQSSNGGRRDGRGEFGLAWGFEAEGPSELPGGELMITSRSARGG